MSQTTKSPETPETPQTVKDLYQFIADNHHLTDDQVKDLITRYFASLDLLRAITYEVNTLLKDHKDLIETLFNVKKDLKNEEKNS